MLPSFRESTDHDLHEVFDDVDQIPPSSISKIPSSTQGVRSSKFKPAAPKRIDLSSRLVEQTPTRGSGRFADRLAPSHSKATVVQASPFSSRTLAPPTLSTSGAVSIGRNIASPPRRPLSTLASAMAITQTPQSERKTDIQISALPYIQVTPCKPTQSINDGYEGSGGQVEDDGIYKALGWTNDLLDE